MYEISNFLSLEEKYPSKVIFFMVSLVLSEFPKVFKNLLRHSHVPNILRLFDG